MQEEPNSDSGTYNVEERENSVTQSMRCMELIDGNNPLTSGSDIRSTVSIIRGGRATRPIAERKANAKRPSECQ